MPYFSSTSFLPHFLLAMSLPHPPATPPPAATPKTSPRPPTFPPPDAYTDAAMARARSKWQLRRRERSRSREVGCGWVRWRSSGVEWFFWKETGVLSSQKISWFYRNRWVSSLRCTGKGWVMIQSSFFIEPISLQQNVKATAFMRFTGTLLSCYVTWPHYANSLLGTSLPRWGRSEDQQRLVSHGTLWRASTTRQGEALRHSKSWGSILLILLIMMLCFGVSLCELVAFLCSSCFFWYTHIVYFANFYRCALVLWMFQMVFPGCFWWTFPACFRFSKPRRPSQEGLEVDEEGRISYSKA